MAMPVIASLAVLQTPMVSALVLQVSLRFVRFQTGLKIEAEAWRVNPFSFSALVKNVRLVYEGLLINAPEIVVQLSPFAAVQGKLHLYELLLRKPYVGGKIPSAWLQDSGETFSWGKEDLPKFISIKSSAFFKRLANKKISFDELSVLGLSSNLKQVSIEKLDLVLESGKQSQLRLDVNVRQLHLPDSIGRWHELRGSLALLRDYKGQYLLAVQSFSASLDELHSTDLTLVGSMPGTFSLEMSSDMPKLNQWVKKAVALEENAVDFPLTGHLHLKGQAETNRQKLIGGQIQVKGRDVFLDGYRPHMVDATVQIVPGDSTQFRVQNFQMELQKTPDAPSDAKNRLTSTNLVIDSSTIVGQIEVDRAQLCAVVYAAAVTECFQDGLISGKLELRGQLSPFALVLTPQLKLQNPEVRSDSFHLRTPKSNLLYLHDAELSSGTAEVFEKKIDFKNLVLSWPNSESRIVTRGSVIYKPSVVRLESESFGIQIDKVVKTFLGIRPMGKGNLSAVIQFDKVSSNGEPRTLVDATANLADFGIEDQVLGEISGPLKYYNDRFDIGTLKLKNGGGFANIRGHIQKHVDKKSKMFIGARLSRLEVIARTKETKGEMFRGFVSGSMAFESSEQSSSLSGPMDLSVENSEAFGIPFQYGAVRARYADDILKIITMRARKNQHEFHLDGDLNPHGGSELRFQTKAFPIQEIRIDPRFELFQSGLLALKGAWRPSQGWEARGSLQQLKIAGRELSSGNIELGGDDKVFKVQLNIENQLKGKFEAYSTVEGLKPYLVSGYVKDQGLYGAMAYLKRWTTNRSIVSTRGEVELEWKPSEGFIRIADLELMGPVGADVRQAVLWRSPGDRVFRWGTAGVIKNDFQRRLGEHQSPTDFYIEGNSGDNVVDLDWKMPLPLVGLFIPNIDLLDGEAVIQGKMPLPPDISTVQVQGQLNQGVIDIRGIGQLMTETQAKIELSRQQANIVTGKGKLGGGNVDFSGLYRLSLYRPSLLLKMNLNRAHLVIGDDLPMDVSGEISLAGENYPYVMSGRVVASDGVYSREFAQSNASAAPAGSRSGGSYAEVPLLKYDLEVEVANNFRIVNSTVKTELKGRLKLSGIDKNPQFKGTLDLTKGSLFANENEFVITQGTVDFPGGEAMPNINIQAYTHIRHTRDYKIELKAIGPANNLMIQFTSDPALPTGDIVNLLAFGYTSSDVQSGTSETTDKAVQAEALQALFGKAIGNRLDASTGFSVKVKASRNQTLETTIPKVTVERRLSDRVNATFGQSLESTLPEQDLQVDYRLLDNMNLTGVWQNRQDNNVEKTSVGADIRFRFEIK